MPNACRISARYANKAPIRCTCPKVGFDKTRKVEFAVGHGLSAVFLKKDSQADKKMLLRSSLTAPMLKTHNVEETVLNTICSYCSVCDRDQNSTLITEHQHVTPNEVKATISYRIVECLGCSSVSMNIKLLDVGAAYDVENGGFLYAMMEGRELTFPPKLHRRQPKWLGDVAAQDRALAGLLWEVYASLNMWCHVLAAIGLRTVFDRAAELLGIDLALPFSRKLDRLMSGGWIGETERELLGVLVDAGSAAAHRGWRPSVENLDTLFDVMEPFLQRAFLTKDKVRVMAPDVPQRPRR